MTAADRTAAAAVWIVVCLLVANALLASINGWPLFSEWVFGFIHTTTFGALGALIVWKQPANRLGWLVLAMTMSGGVGAVAFQYGVAGVVQPRTLPAADLVGGLGFGLLAVPFGVLITLFLLLFPDGRLLSRRWAPVAWVAGAGIVLMVVGSALAAVGLGTREVLRQLALGGFVGVGLGRVINEIGHVLVFAVFPVAVLSLFVRRVRAGPVERRQLQWFAYGAVLVLASIFVPWPEPLWFLLEAAATIFLPVSVGIAITRHRLYEIDRIIGRTVTYAAVTAVLVAVYALVAVVPTTVLGLESDLQVAAATLAAAGLFVPVRRRVQAVVDRRFNRARYDAQRVVERFGERVRADLDVDVLAGDLRGVVATTVQPAHLSLWLVPARSDP